jgi:hypothetical protein
MDYFQNEGIFSLFTAGLVSSVSGGPANQSISGVTVCRDNDLELRIELTTPGWVTDRSSGFQPGEVRTATEELHFEHIEGSRSIARGVIYRGIRSSSGVSKPTETVWTYTAHSLELDFRRAELPVHTIEWVGNVPRGFIWSGRTSAEENSVYTQRIGNGEATVTMTHTGRSAGSTSALHLRIDGVDLYLLQAETRDQCRQPGRIVYKGCHSEEIRKRIRLCLSFALGLPLVYYGHTDYSFDWHPTFMKAYDAMSIGGAMFALHDLPPYPINDRRYANVLDGSAVNQIINSLYAKYDELRFNELSWAYWYAVCAPVHTAAVHFGGLIEQLQKSAAVPFRTDRKGLLDEATWRDLLTAIRAKMAAMDLPNDIRPVLHNKVGSLNQLPQNLALKRLLDRLGLRIGTAELDAWKHRNMAAHGSISEDAVEVILNAKLLKLLFHRLLAAVTFCSDRYIDYYNLDFPVRPIVEGVPLREATQTA